ncbi:hypothetical protein D3C78_1722400 [compost metagenome]
MIAEVAGVMASSTRAGSRLQVTGSISTNTGLRPFHSTECVVATKEYGVVITSPVIRRAWRAATRASVPLANRQICSIPR